MRKLIPILLWSAVIITFSILAYVRYQQILALSDQASDRSLDPPGRFLDDIPWKHFNDIPPFQMVDQTGEPFDSRTLAGKPYLLNFFFVQCPTSCRDLNAQMASVNEQLRKEDLHLVSITIDPKNDTPEVLQRYAQDYDARPDRWTFLTDQSYKILELGEHVFQVPIGSNPQAHTHVEDILLVDKWGRFRDRFRWDDPFDMRRLLAVVKDVCAETGPPINQKFRSRNAMAGQIPLELNRVPRLRDFHLTDSYDQPFYSRDLTGQVWIAYFFNLKLADNNPAVWNAVKQVIESTETEPLAIVGITTDPANDTVDRLREWKNQQAWPENWKLLTGQGNTIERIGSEFFKVQALPGMVSNRIFVIDRWHRVRGSFLPDEPEEIKDLLTLLKQLADEDTPNQFLSTKNT